MDSILSFEADRRTINITVNSLGTALSKEQRASLFPAIGKLYPAGNNALARADEMDQVKQVVEMVPEYREFFTATTNRGVGEFEDEATGGGAALAENLEDHFFRVSRFTLLCFVETQERLESQTEVHLNKLAFLQQFQCAYCRKSNQVVV